MLLLIVALVFFVGWLVAEAFGGQATRIVIGVIAIVSVSIAIAEVNDHLKDQRNSRMNSFYRTALLEMQRSVESGDEKRAILAIKTFYDSYHRPNSPGPESATLEMLQVLRPN